MDLHIRNDISASTSGLYLTSEHTTGHLKRENKEKRKQKGKSEGSLGKCLSICFDRSRHVVGNEW